MASDTSPPPTCASPEEELMDTFEFPPSSTSSAVKKARRQTAFYPNMNPGNKPQKPFSRSAAKRESVMALGSIEHLQHYFTKTGIAAKQNPLKQNSGLVPAIGNLTNRPLKPSLGSIQEFHLPPSPAIPAFTRPPYPQVEKTYEVDPEALKPGVIRYLESVSEAWGLGNDSGKNHLSVDKGNGKVDEDFDVLATMQLTTRLIRSVRNYLLSLPDDSGIPESDRPHFRPRTFTPAPMKRVVSNPTQDSDPLARIRRSALDVLTVLRNLEETARLPLSDEAYDAQSDHVSSQDTTGSRSPAASQSHLETEDEQEHDHENGHTPAHDISFAISVVSIPGRSEAVPVWDDEDAYDRPDDEDDTREKREVWDERLVLGGGWLYRQDIRLTDLVRERDVLGKYLDTVDEALFQGPGADGRRGWERAASERAKTEKDGKARRTSLGRDEKSPDRGNKGNRVVSGDVLQGMRDMVITEEAVADDEGEDQGSVDDEDLPEWAKRSTYSEDPLARTHALLTSLLPNTLLPLLPIPYISRAELLTALSSGQLLCVAYNTGVRRSRKPWGYVNRDSVHDIAALEAKAATDADGDGEARRTGWTFRRTDNLRLWAAALKLRYLIPLTTPLPPTPTPSAPSTPGRSSPAKAAPAPGMAFPPPSSPAASPTPKARFGASATAEPPLVFDAKAIARLDDGWEAMLEAAVLRWVRAVVEEKRGER